MPGPSIISRDEGGAPLSPRGSRLLGSRAPPPGPPKRDGGSSLPARNPSISMSLYFDGGMCGGRSNRPGGGTNERPGPARADAKPLDGAGTGPDRDDSLKFGTLGIGL